MSPRLNSAESACQSEPPPPPPPGISHGNNARETRQDWHLGECPQGTGGVEGGMQLLGSEHGTSCESERERKGPSG